jgi:hypothetical protein
MHLGESKRTRSRFRGKHSVPEVALSETRLSVWEERDRAHVELINTKNDATIVEWWDDQVREAIEDGFLKPGKLHETAYDYAVHVGLINRPRGPIDPATSIQRSYPLPPPRTRENPVHIERGSVSDRKVVQVTLDYDSHFKEWTAIAWDKNGNSVNIIRGKEDEEQAVRAAIRKHWPGVRVDELKPRTVVRESPVKARDRLQQRETVDYHGENIRLEKYLMDDGTTWWSAIVRGGHWGATTRGEALRQAKSGVDRLLRENPVQARDYDSADDALAKVHEFLGAEWYVRDGNKITVYAYSGEELHGRQWYEAKLVKSRGLYHWPSDWEKKVKSLPRGARPIAHLERGPRTPGGVSREANECGCEHGCGAKENPVEISDGIPWVKSERNAEDFKEIRAVAEKVGPITGARDVYNLMEPWTSRQDKEHLVVILLDIHSMLRGVSVVHIGTRDRVTVDPSDVLKPAIDRGAKGLAILHNHPSGAADHSTADASLTKAIKKACDANDIAFVDHVVIGEGQYYSFADKKLYKVK